MSALLGISARRLLPCLPLDMSESILAVSVLLSWQASDLHFAQLNRFRAHRKIDGILVRVGPFSSRELKPLAQITRLLGYTESLQVLDVIGPPTCDLGIHKCIAAQCMLPADSSQLVFEATRSSSQLCLRASDHLTELREVLSYMKLRFQSLRDHILQIEWLIDYLCRLDEGNL